MGKLFKAARGAVSIFLIIVLLPMLMVASVMVDSARIRLAKAEAAAAADLALNTALTDYDAQLKDLYGLFATSQNIDELLGNLEEYYRTSIEAAGIPPAEADDYVAQIMSMLKSSTGTDDLMRIRLTGFETEKPTGGNLANPGMLKAQIIDFMKYRGPIDIGIDFLDALNGLKDIDKQSTNMDNKTKFYEEQQSLLKELELAWNQIQAYQYQDAADNFPTGNYIQQRKTNLDKYLNDLKHDTAANSSSKEYISDTVKYLRDLKYFYDPKCGIEFEEGDADDVLDDAWIFKWNRTETRYVSIYQESDTVTADDVFRETQNVLDAIRELENIKREAANSDSPTIYKLIGQTGQSVSDEVPAVYLVKQFNEKGGTYAKAVGELVHSLVNLQGAMEVCLDEDLNALKVSKVSEYDIDYADSGSSITLRSIAKSQIDSHLDRNDEYFVYYIGNAGKLTRYFNDYSTFVTNKARTVDAAVKGMQKEAANAYALAVRKINNLTEAIRHLTTVKNYLNGTEGDYKSKLDAWSGSAANVSDTGMGKADQGEIAKLKEQLTVEKVQQLIDRLNGAKSSMEAFRDEIAAYKFEETSIKDFATNQMGYEVLEGRMTKGERNQINSINPTSNDAYNNTIDGIEAKAVKGNPATSWNNSVHPDLALTQIQLYTWLYNNYYDPQMIYGDQMDSSSQSTSGDEAFQQTKDDLQAKSKAEVDKGNADQKATTDIGSARKDDFNTNADLKNLPSLQFKPSEIFTANAPNGEKDPADMLSESTSGVKSLLGGLLKELGNMTTDFRDDLYLTDYIMKMFSYDTYEAEIERKAGENVELSDAFESWYKADQDGTFTLKSSKEDFEKKAVSLTNNPINPACNYLYGKEVEYIVYGNADGAVNAYATIFMLRFVLNSIYAFTDAEISNTTLAAATALFGVPPLTPLIPVAKIAMTLGLALAESGYDLAVLKTGAAVPLFKTSSTWMMKPTALGKKIAAEVTKTVANTAIEKGLEKIDTLLDMTEEELQNYVGKTGDDLKDLTNATENAIKEKYHNYANEALQEATNLCNAVNQELMYNEHYTARQMAEGIRFDLGSSDKKVQMVEQRLNEWLQSQRGAVEASVYEAQSLAVDYILQHSEVAGIFDAIKDTSENALNTLDDKLDSITSNINAKVDSGCAKMNEMISDTKTKLSEAASEGAASLRKELNAQIDRAFGASTGGAVGASGMATSLISWAYSDYLMMFLLVAVILDQDGVVLRTADMIQMNMQLIKNDLAKFSEVTSTTTTSRFFGLIKKTETTTSTELSERGYSLSEAYTFLRIKATMDVDPLLMYLPFMGEQTHKQLDGTNWYQISCSASLGY